MEGTLTSGKKYASGRFEPGSVLEVRGLPFKPRIIHCGEQHGGSYYQFIRNADYGNTTYFTFTPSWGRKQSGFVQYEDGFKFPEITPYIQYWYAFE